LALGAVPSADATTFRVWAPEARRVEVVFESPAHPPLLLERGRDGYHVGSATLTRGLYKYLVAGKGPWPDPCSRFQPLGVHGPSQIVGASEFEWTDAGWRGVRLPGQILYEVHVGTFTSAGTFDGAVERLEYLRDLGVTLIELMPVAQCPGRWNWGYDGVQLFAPSHMYGDADALRRFVDRAHALGLGVILDVVYNHLGPDGNYLRCFSEHYFSRRHRTDWGEALNFDDEHARGARDFVIGNALHWIRDYHLDGFRLDATQSIFDDSDPHVLAELIAAARETAAPRDIVVISENERQESEQLLPPDAGGLGLDAMWNDDFHHSARVALTGSRDGYLLDYTGRSQELVSCVRRGFLYQGQWYAWQKQSRGSALRDIDAWACVIFLQNHDQVGNTYTGIRIHAQAAPATYRALMALTLLAPQTPMLFMGQEFAASTPFAFFADHNPELSRKVHAGRREFAGQFRAYADPRSQERVPAPDDEAAFAASHLDWSEADTHAEALLFHRELIALRRKDPVISRQDASMLDGATLSEHALALRWFDEEPGDRLLVVNFGHELPTFCASEPLLAPPRDRRWEVEWGSEDPRYGGHGVAPPVEDGGRGPWRLQAHCAVLLTARRPKT
jgi:maltooligosyltrehalose trehalohydrolase